MRRFVIPVLAMMVVITVSNLAVQYPFTPFGLGDVLTWGAFTYPFAFLVNDLTNRSFGPRAARSAIYAGFATGVISSAILGAPRIAIASGTAFLLGQLLDVLVFGRLRRLAWWRAPLAGSVVGSALDTTIFFSLAFAAVFSVLGPNMDFALQSIGFWGLPVMAPRWVSWAGGDFVVKMISALCLLVPYRAVLRRMPVYQPAGG
ncbi:VUT family protein [Acidisoma sp. S159]|jgi:uncharacterized PurR-regulated membrane protein YhhQ (DUF165 family)|uniref:VUT family protein n=1 Tax=Acidisoma sp. S159 TaxID=1747225 RepID=UPI00131E1654|nr:VUT family protein [Acidisoma sp. S159]